MNKDIVTSIYGDQYYLNQILKIKELDSEEERKLLNLLDFLNENHVRFALSNVFEHKGRRNDILIEWANKYNVHVVHSNYISYYDNSIKTDTIEVLITNF